MNKNTSMLEGKIWNKLLLFALPLAASSILQQLFNSADVAVVGQFAGSNALAAVGANGPIINLLVNSFVGLSVGANAVISAFIGQGKNEDVKKAVHTSMTLSFIIGIFLLLIGVFFAPGMLELISTPDNILNLAITYLRIYFIGVPFIILYNFEAAILRSHGNTKRPLISLFIAGIVNLILNIFFVVVCHMSVEGVAIATVISNVISSLDLFFYLTKSQSNIQVKLKELKLDKDILKKICQIGVPAGLQGAMFSIANLIIQSFVNSFGSNAIAGSAAALNYEYFAYYILSAFGQASVTFVGQNYGANKLDRCRSILRCALIEGAILTGLFSIICIIFKNPLISIFTTDPQVAEIAKIRLTILLSFELLNMSIEVFSGTMRGYGYSTVPAIITVFGICIVRMLWVFIIVSRYNTYTMLMLCYPISWIVTVLGLLIAYIHLIKKFNQERV
jgi:putative MATE family efflux protein